MDNKDRICNFNLHLHTNVSDGALTPKRLIRQAIERNIDLISITDHDTVDAYHHIHIADYPIHILPGLEISAQEDGIDIHILAYGIDIHDRNLIDLLAMYLHGRKDRAKQMILKLKKLGINIDIKDVIAIAGSRELIVRPHIAQVMVNKGYCSNKNEAFDLYIGNEKPAYVPKPEVRVKDAIEVIQGAGGFAVLAHPGKLKDAIYLQKCIDQGIDGLEVWHPDHNNVIMREFIDLGQMNDLYLTGGTDFHGEQDFHNQFGFVPHNEVIINSVNDLWRAYQCKRR